MDSLAADLIDDAWHRFGGHEPSQSSGSGTVRERALSLAKGQLGIAESPAGSNLQKYGAWYGMNGVPWCAIFTSWAYVQAAEGRETPSFAQGSRYSYVPYIVGDARAGLHELRTVDDPLPGDLVCYDFGGDGVYDHVGLFDHWTGSNSFEAVEGNTSPQNDVNGGEVMRRSRSRTAQVTTFVRAGEP
jgi:hypothetical protein